jgi:hypothetical protein
MRRVGCKNCSEPDFDTGITSPKYDGATLDNGAGRIKAALPEQNGAGHGK